MTVLYTPLPLELIMFAEDSTSPYQDINLDGVTLTVQPTATGMGRIVRINSTDPSYYLRPEFQPGQQISLSEYQI